MLDYGSLNMKLPCGYGTEVIDKLNKAINAELADPKMMTRIIDLGSTVFTSCISLDVGGRSTSPFLSSRRE